MNSMKKILAIILSLALCCMLIPAVADDADVVGTWFIAYAEQEGFDIQVIDPTAICLDVKEDGTFALGMSAYGVEQAGTWTLADNMITLAPDIPEDASEAEAASLAPISFEVSDGEILYSTGVAVVHLSRTPAEPMLMAAYKSASSAADFDGMWVPKAQIVMGLYAELSEEQIAATGKLSVEDGTLITMYDLTGDGTLTPVQTTKLEFADGILTGEDSEYTNNTYSVCLLEDETLLYQVTMEMGGSSVTVTYTYVRDTAAEEAPAA